MSQRVILLFLFTLSGLSVLSSCSQDGAPENNPASAPASATADPSTALSQEDVIRLLSQTRMKPDGVINILAKIQGEHPELSAEALAFQLDRLIEIRCDSAVCEITRRDRS